MPVAQVYSVTKSFSFDAAHQLTSMPDGHPCKRLHGHTYNVEVTVGSVNIDHHGMVLDFTIFKELKDKLDHRNLNDILEGPTTSEMLCRYVYQWLDFKLVSLFGIEARQEMIIEQVTVSETPTSRATLRMAELQG